MDFTRRTFIAAGTVAASLPALAGARAARAASTSSPKDFLWGVATAGHQVEGNNVASDTWCLENIKPTIFKERSGDACNSLTLWPRDMDIVRDLGLGCYRFSIEWARIEPEQGLFSVAMLDHYKRMIAGCRERGLVPMVTFNHFTCPRWFAALGGWTNPGAPDLFARYCERAARHLGAGIGYATTLNEPNILRLLKWFGLPAPLLAVQEQMLAAAAVATGSRRFVAANAASWAVADEMLPIMIAAHKQGRAAIKAVLPDLPVGVSLAISDDQAVGRNSRRDEKRADVCAAWLDAAKTGDFLGVQNYDRTMIDVRGPLPPPAGAPTNQMGAEVFPPSLGGAVRYAHAATGLPIMVTEHGLGTNDDAQRAAFIPAALAGLKAAIDDGIPVKGYVHWSLLDNFEWIFGYGPHFGLVAVDRTTFERSPKPSAAVLGGIARRNAL